MAVKRITFNISTDDTSRGQSYQDVMDEIEAELAHLDPDYISPLPSDRCVDTKLNTKSVFKAINRHLRGGDTLWVGGLTQWPQFTKIDPSDLAWLKSRLK
jgi:hypothetical protein